jgi:small subunit ribosomal protein S16
VAVKIKLKRLGKMRDPHYRIIVADARTKRDGRAIEEIGQYHPKSNPSVIEVNSERVQYWLGVGAQPTGPVAAILRVTGDWQKYKGEPAPEPMKKPEPKPDRRAVFEAAAKEAAGEAKQSDKDADKGRPGARKSAAKKTSAKKASAPKADEVKAESGDTAEQPAPAEQGGSDDGGQASDQPAKG